MAFRIPFNKPCVVGSELDYVQQAIANGHASGDGPFTRSVQNFIEDQFGARRALLTTSCTAALELGALLCDLEPGDEVILPSYTFVSTANAAVLRGAKPVFVDINTRDYTIDLLDLKAKITQKSKAIIPVHLYGHPSDMGEIAEIAAANSLEIIEDACQSLGSTYRQIQTGTIGKIGCFSFYASKVLTSGEGGAISTKDEKLAATAKMIRNHGMVEGNDTRRLGLNLRLPELSAALASAQMNRLQTLLDLRRKNSKTLTELLSSLEGNINIPLEGDQKKFNWYLYTVAFDKERTRDKIRDSLINKEIGATVYYNPPVHKTPYYKNAYPVELSNTDWAASHVLSLPVHPHLTEEDMKLIVSCIRKEI